MIVKEKIRYLEAVLREPILRVFWSLGIVWYSVRCVVSRRFHDFAAEFRNDHGTSLRKDRAN